jgi:hypothetical protein
VCDHGGPFTAVVRRGNLVTATQFHPEKSQDNGLQLLQNWLAHEFAMLKKRIIPKFLIRGGRLVKMRRFHDDFSARRAIRSRRPRSMTPTASTS